MSHHPFSFAVCAFVVLTFLSPAYAAAPTSQGNKQSGGPVYTWTDASGKLMFSDRPPLEPEKVKIKGDEDASKKADEKGDDTRAALAREEAKKRKIKEVNKNASAWRCQELKDQYEKTLAELDKPEVKRSTKAVMLKTDADNYKTTIDRMCK